MLEYFQRQEGQHLLKLKRCWEWLPAVAKTDILLGGFAKFFTQK